MGKKRREKQGRQRDEMRKKETRKRGKARSTRKRRDGIDETSMHPRNGEEKFLAVSAALSIREAVNGRT